MHTGLKEIYKRWSGPIPFVYAEKDKFKDFLEALFKASPRNTYECINVNQIAKYSKYAEVDVLAYHKFLLYLYNIRDLINISWAYCKEGSTLPVVLNNEQQRQLFSTGTIFIDNEIVHNHQVYMVVYVTDELIEIFEA